MKKLIRFILFFPIAVLVISLFFAQCEGKGNSSDFSVFTCLVAGYDEAAENTDVLFIVSYSRDKNEISFVQIPRDTFSEYNGSYGKINRIYSLSRASGKSGDDSLEELRYQIDRYFGIKLDAAVALSFSALVRLVDNVGGVYINVPESVRLEDMPIELSYGENVLSGEEALKLVRARNKYPGGDLTRLDTQKIFLEGVFHTLFERLDAKRLVKLVLTSDDEVFVDAPLLELSALLIRDFNDIKNAGVTLLTLPGEACEYNGKSYYVINRIAAVDAVKKYLHTNADGFDKNLKFTDSGNYLINEIYERKSFSYKIYADGRTIDIKVS
ncbi:MAG: LCP family protein [Clostridia bacterium]|nr:LCP family protein [Clostridia bacterium]